MRRLVRCVCLLILLAEASGCKSVRQSTASQRAQWEGEVERELTAVVDSVLRYELEGSSRWEWTQLDCSLDTVRPDATAPRLRVTRLTRTASVAARRESAVGDSLAVRSKGQVQERSEQSAHDTRQTRTPGLSLLGLVGAIVVVLSIIYIIIKRR